MERIRSGKGSLKRVESGEKNGRIRSPLRAQDFRDDDAICDVIFSFSVYFLYSISPVLQVQMAPN